MSTSVEHTTPAAGNRFVEFDEFIDYQLGKTSHGIRSTDLMTGVVGAILGVCVYLFVFIVMDHWVIPGGFGLWARMALWVLGIAGLTTWLILRIGRPYRRRINTLFAAREIERTRPELKSSLLTLIDLKQAGRNAPAQIRGSLEKRAAVNLSKADVDQAVNRQTLMHCSYGLLGVLAAFCLYALLSPKSMAQSAWRALAPFSNSAAVTRTRIDKITPGDVTVPAYSQVDLEVELSGQAPNEVLALYSTQDQKFVDEPVTLRDTGEGLRRYRGTLLGEDGRGLRQSISYRVVAGDAVSNDFQIDVVQPPSAAMNDVAYRYPAYMSLADKTESGGAIDAWEGTRVVLHATANMPVRSGSVLFSDSEDTSVKAEELPLTVTDGTKLSAEWQLTLRSDGTFPKFYRLQVRNEAGHSDPRPVLYPIRIRADQPPKIELLAPKGDVTAPANGTVSVAFKASDPDFQLRSVVMHFEKEGQELPEAPRLFEGPPDQTAVDGVYKIRLSDMNLAAGSRLTWWLQARDNLEPFGSRGANQTVTPKLNIDIVAPQGAEDVQKQADASEQGAQQALDQSRQEGSQGTSQEAEEEAGNQESEPADNPPTDDPSTDGDNPPEGKNEGEAGPNDDSAGGEASQGDESQSPQPSEGTSNPSQPADSGEKSPDAGGQQGENVNQGDSGTPSPSNPDQKNSGQKNSDQTNSAQEKTGGTSRPNSTAKRQNSSQPTEPRTGDKAQDDEALDRLMRWSHEKQRAERQRGESRPEPATSGQRRDNPDDSGKSPDHENASREETNPEESGTDNRTEGSNPRPESDNETKKPGEPRDNSTRPEGPSHSPGDSDPEQTSGEKPAGESVNDRTSSPPDASTAPSGENKSNSAENEQPMSAAKPGESANNPQQPATQSRQPGETEERAADDAEKNPAGESPGSKGEPQPPSTDGSRTSAPGEAPPESTAEKRTGNDDGPQPPEKQADNAGAERPETTDPQAQSDANADKGKTEPQNEEGTDPTQEPAPAPGTQTPKDNPAKSPSKEEQEKSGQKARGESSSSTPGETNQSSKGEPTQGESNERRNVSNDASRSDENRGKASEQPVGQPDEGERSGGEGNSGSSTAGKTGDQKTGGPGEAGESASKSASQDSGSAKGSSGSKPSADGSSSKPGSSQKGGSESSEKPSAGSPSESSSGTSGDKPKTSSSKPMEDDQTSESGSSEKPAGDSQKGGSGSGKKSEQGGESQESAESGEAPSSEGASQESGSEPGSAPSEKGAAGSEESGGQSSKQGGKGESGKGKGGEGKGGEGSSEGTGGQASEGGQSKSGGSSGSGAGSSGAKGLGTPGQSGSGTAGAGNSSSNHVDDSGATADPADLENRKKAANLALKRLQDTLERGELDPALQKELGFTDEDLAAFMERLEQRLADTGDDDSPEAQARRRQFESLLRSIDLSPQSAQRAGNGEGPAGAGFAAPKRPAPLEYRSSESQYKKRISEQRTKKP